MNQFVKLAAMLAASATAMALWATPAIAQEEEEAISADDGAVAADENTAESSEGIHRRRWGGYGYGYGYGYGRHPYGRYPYRGYYPYRYGYPYGGYYPYRYGYPYGYGSPYYYPTPRYYGGCNPYTGYCW